MNDPISVIVTTFNREDALDAVLGGLARQRDRDFEVIVADDGSGPATADLVRARQSRFPVDLTHVWQPDEGFRAAEIRNRGIRASRGRYLVFLDGDCVPRPGYIAGHRRLAASGWFVAGGRVLVSKGLTGEVLAGRRTTVLSRHGAQLVQRLRGGINAVVLPEATPLGPLRRLRPGRWTGIRSANLGAWRSDVEAIDGFDGAFRGWGLEDSDFVIRLIRHGVRRKDGRFATTVLHLWHPGEDRTSYDENAKILTELVNCDRVRARAGISRCG